ncbi:MAG: response regulator, partial [Bradymonadaceae bacterium]
MQQISEPEERIRILMVDDDEDDRLLVEDMLSEITSLDCDFTWCESYEAGLDAVLADDHDIYLIDYYLGIHFGLDIVRQARRRGILAPMILLTGREDAEVDDAAAAAGAA